MSLCSQKRMRAYAIALLDRYCRDDTDAACGILICGGWQPSYFLHKLIVFLELDSYPDALGRCGIMSAYIQRDRKLERIPGASPGTVDSLTDGSAIVGRRRDCFVIENLKISGDALMSKVNDLIGQGNVHRIVIKNKEGHTLLSVPTTLNAMGSSIEAILSTEATAINVISAIVPYPKVVVEKLG